MNIETISDIQLISIGTIGSVIIIMFTIYQFLFAQKNSTIERLTHDIKHLERKLKDAEKVAPDALVEALSERVEASLKEISRLKTDGEEYEGQILEIENVLEETRNHLNNLSEEGLLCPKCHAPLIRKYSTTTSNEMHGREVEYDIEFTEYECGYSVNDAWPEPISKCGNCN